MMPLNIDTTKTVLSSEVSVCMTERFISQCVFAGANAILCKISDAIILNIKDFAKGSFIVRLDNLGFRFALHENNLVFFGFESDDFIRNGDTQYMKYLGKPEFVVHVEKSSEPVASADLLKLYRLSTIEKMYFPYLNEEQSKIVQIEDQNVLVQGVAGSGKTNICIDKIVYSAARGYAGRVMYSTFSRGLLVNTKSKVLEFISEIRQLIDDFDNKKVIFHGNDKAKAIENKLGIYLPMNSKTALANLVTVADYLENKVDYVLIEDIYKQHISQKFDIADERFFTNTFLKEIKNHQLKAKLSSLAHLSYEVIYKEIFGMIGGWCDPGNPQSMPSLNDYIDRRKHSFTKDECTMIFSLASDFFDYLKKNNLTDNNLMCRAMLGVKLPRYSLVVLDEVQDMTEVNLVFFKSIAMKLFCVGDALQMINASYFSFSFLKRLLYEKDNTSVAELVSNYRSTRKIAEIAEQLGTLNTKCFGVHSFVLSNKSVDDNIDGETAFISDGDFLRNLDAHAYNNYTIVVANTKEREFLRQHLKKQEILTVAEIKGLERETVILYNLLSSNSNHWRTFERISINRKTADENSIFRYYFNLFYVGISRAKTRLYINETDEIKTFKEFITDNLLNISTDDAIDRIVIKGDKTEAEQDEIVSRVKEFTRLEQYENARFTAQKILNTTERTHELHRIDIAEQFIRRGNHRESGIAFMKYAMYKDAKEQFLLLEDEALVKLAEACIGSAELHGLDVLPFFYDMQDNETVRQLIVNLVQEDLQNMKKSIKLVSEKLSQIKGSKWKTNK